MRLTEFEIEEKFEELLKQAPDDDFGRLIRNLAQRGLSLEQKEFMIDKGGSADLVVDKISNINKQFYINNKEIYEGSATFSNYSMYFIQLRILTDEVKKYFQKQSESEEINLILKITVSYIEKVKKVEKAIHEFKEQLSCEEWHMIEFVRNNFCHLTMSKYHIQWSANGQTFSKELNGIYRADMRDVISKELNKYDGNIKLLAENLVTKTYPKLQILFDAIEEWEQVNKKVQA